MDVSPWELSENIYFYILMTINIENNSEKWPKMTKFGFFIMPFQYLFICKKCLTYNISFIIICNKHLHVSLYLCKRSFHLELKGINGNNGNNHTIYQLFPIGTWYNVLLNKKTLLKNGKNILWYIIVCRITVND